MCRVRPSGVGGRVQPVHAAQQCPAGVLLPCQAGFQLQVGTAACALPPAEDPAIAQQLNVMRGAINDLSDQIIGSSAVLLDGEREDVRSRETNLGAQRALAGLAVQR